VFGLVRFGCLFGLFGVYFIQRWHFCLWGFVSTTAGVSVFCFVSIARWMGEGDAMRIVFI